MLKDITGIHLEGANFSAPSNIQLFVGENLHGNSTSRICLLYGKNGAGKTTISRGFKKITDTSYDGIKAAMPIDANGVMVPLSEEEKSRIVVFNEEFIEKQIRFQQEGLETVVVLGAAVDVEEQLNEALDRLSDLKDKKEEATKIVSKLRDSTNNESPRYWLYQIGNSLKGPNNWAERDMTLREGARQATRVNDNTFQQFLNRKPTKSRDDLLYDFKCFSLDLKRARSGEGKITAIVPQYNLPLFDESSFNSLLSEKIEEPTLSDREKYLLSLVKQGKTSRVQEIKAFASNPKPDVCPFCLQDVSIEHKASLISSVEKVLSEVAENHKKRLEQFRRQPISFNPTPFVALGDTTLKCERAVQDYNDKVDIINALIDQKQSNVFTPITVNIDLSKNMDMLLAAVTELESKKQAHNKSVTDVKPIIEKLHEINDDIASYDIAEPYEKYLVQLQVQKDANEKHKTLEEQYKSALDAVRSLQEKKKSVVIAKDLINRWLSYIFFSQNRISLEADSGKYYVKSSGNAIPPEKLSTGERNSLALCYFFSTIMQGKEKDKVYNEPYLIVIDDPVSSFDIENCIGVLSFLKCQLQPYLCSQNDTKVLIMTHDLQAYFDLQKASEELANACSRTGKKCTFSHLELVRNNIAVFKVKKRHEYTELLKDVYRFAICGDEEKLATIGNSMRRVVEAFSSFLYKCSIQELSTRQDILGQIDPAVAPYFEHLLYRLVLNGGSHMEERVQTMETLDLDAYLSKETLQRTAKDILCLLYCLNSVHVKTHLQELASADNDICSWIADIKQNTP